MVEIEGMRKTAESRLATLEMEVGQMREEAKALHELLEDLPKEKVSLQNVQKTQLSTNPN
ncbi:MAG: hypothetical protein ACBZ72_12190 [Candidatus Bathyarchaeia archaeon]